MKKKIISVPFSDCRELLWCSLNLNAYFPLNKALFQQAASDFFQNYGVVAENIPGVTGSLLTQLQNAPIPYIVPFNIMNALTFLNAASSQINLRSSGEEYPLNGFTKIPTVWYIVIHAENPLDPMEQLSKYLIHCAQHYYEFQLRSFFAQQLSQVICGEEEMLPAFEAMINTLSQANMRSIEEGIHFLFQNNLQYYPDPAVPNQEMNHGMWHMQLNRLDITFTYPREQSNPFLLGDFLATSFYTSFNNSTYTEDNYLTNTNFPPEYAALQRKLGVMDTDSPQTIRDIGLRASLYRVKKKLRSISALMDLAIVVFEYFSATDLMSRNSDLFQQRLSSFIIEHFNLFIEEDRLKAIQFSMDYIAQFMQFKPNEVSLLSFMWNNIKTVLSKLNLMEPYNGMLARQEFAAIVLELNMIHDYLHTDPPQFDIPTPEKAASALRELTLKEITSPQGKKQLAAKLFHHQLCHQLLYVTWFNNMTRLNAQRRTSTFEDDRRFLLTCFNQRSAFQ